MPLKCPNNEKPRYRWKGGVRLAFCGSAIVETKVKGGTAKKVKKHKVLHRK